MADHVRGCKSRPDTGKGTHVSSRQEAAVIMAYLRSKSSGNRVKASVGSKTRSSGPLFSKNNQAKRYIH